MQYTTGMVVESCREEENEGQPDLLITSAVRLLDRSLARPALRTLGVRRGSRSVASPFIALISFSASSLLQVHLDLPSCSAQRLVHNRRLSVERTVRRYWQRRVRGRRSKPRCFPPTPSLLLSPSPPIHSLSTPAHSDTLTSHDRRRHLPPHAHRDSPSRFLSLDLPPSEVHRRTQAEEAGCTPSCR